MLSPTLRPLPIRDALPSVRQTAFSVGLLAVLYLWVFPYHPVINNPNENVRVYMTISIVDDHTFAIDRLSRDPQWGYVNDKATRLGKLYSSKAPGSSYLGVPAYWFLTKVTGRNSLALTPAQIAAHHKPPLDHSTIIYVLRLWSNVLPALIFAWFWHRFLGKHTRFPALREAIFFSSMAGSLLFAYSEMFASHSINAFCGMAAIMALATIRERDRSPVQRTWSLGLFVVAGLFGSAATMFEYPAAFASIAVALLILATCADVRQRFVYLSIALIPVSAKLYLGGHKLPAAICFALAAGAYAATLSLRSVARLAAAGVGAIVPTGLTLFYHARCFGNAFKPGYSYLENTEFNAQTSQGFFGATSFSWEACVRLWFDPAFGLISMTAILLFAAPGFGAYFSWRPNPRWVAPVRAGVLAIFVFAFGMAIRAMLALKDGGWHESASGQMQWIGFLAIATMLLGSVTLRKPTRADGGIAAAMILSCYGLTRLIGMMNNWRGGWQVGPRYLATLVPILSLASLGALDAFAQVSPSRRRAATLVAAGATVSSMIVSGIPSAYFPHIPTEFASPLFELFIPLLRGGLAPHNAGQYLFHWSGLTGMIPFFAAATIAAVLVLRGDERRSIPFVAHFVGGLSIAILFLVPFALTAKYDTMSVTRWVRGIWEPHVLAPSQRTLPNDPHGASDTLRLQGRERAEGGDSQGALDAYRRAITVRPR